jgi:hypothetical protein
LRDEILLIHGGWSDWVMMIDDFEVPGDHGYGYDDYGSEGRLNLSYLPLDRMRDTSIFFPAAPSKTETGYRRGCVILSSGKLVTDRLISLSRLRVFHP